ncbi:MAG: M50 family metallopeptidase [Thermoprotei archaeon]
MGEPKEKTIGEKVARILVYMPESKRAGAAIQRLSKNRLASLFFYLGIPVFACLAVLAFYLMLGTLSADIASSTVRALERSVPLQAYILIPGLNPFVPVVYGLIGLVVAVSVHEVSHGVAAWRAGIPVEGAGVVFVLFVPVGAFVRPSEKELEGARPLQRVSVFTAGVTSNLILALACLGLIVLLLLPAVSVQPYASKGVAIFSLDGKNSPAGLAGLRPGDVITAIENHPVTNISQLQYLETQVLKPGENVSVTTSLNKTFYVRLEPNPSNKSIAILGIFAYDASQALSQWKHPTGILQYFVPVTYEETPFNPVAGVYYRFPIPLWQPVADTLFWIWWVSISLGVFNALPAFYLDGGQVAREFFRFVFKGSKGGEEKALKATGYTSYIVLLLFLLLILVPRIL